MLKSNIIGIDLAKNILQICHISKQGELISNKAVSRQKLKQILANQQPAVVAIEGCGSAIIGGDMQRSLAMMYGSLALRK